MDKNYKMCGRLFKQAEQEMLDLGHPYVGSEHLLLSILKSDNEIVDKLAECNLTYNNFKKELIKVVGKGTRKSQNVLYTPLLKRVIDMALEDAKENNNGLVTPNHLILSLIEEGEGIAIRLLVGMNIDIEKIYQKISKKSFIKNSLIYEIGNVLNNSIKKDEKIVGRDIVINQMIEILLRKNKNNPLLIGPAGVGKTAIVEELTRRIIKGSVPNELLNKKIIALEMSFLISGTKYRGEFEERLTKIINEVKEDSSIILFIDEIHTLIGAGGAEGAIDASNILKPYLARGDIKCIGATTISEYNKSIAKDKALERRFQTITINEPNIEETIFILNTIKNEYSKHHNVLITKQNINDIVLLADKYIYNKNNPDKSIEILDSVCTRVKLKNIHNINKNELLTINQEKSNKIKEKKYYEATLLKEKEIDLTNKIKNKKIKITKEVITEVILNRCNFNMNEYLIRLNNLRDKLNTSIYNKEIQEKVLYALQKYRSNDKPLTMLIAGNKGIGKKCLTNTIISELKIHKIELDMNEYNDYTSISKLLGTSQGYIGYDDDYVLEDIISNPCSLLFIKNIEMAHKKVISIIQKIITDGEIISNKGDKLIFKQAIILINWNTISNNKIGFDAKNNNKNTLFNNIVSYIYIDKPTKETIWNIISQKLNSDDLKLIDSIYEKAECSKYYLKNIEQEINNLQYTHN